MHHAMAATEAIPCRRGMELEQVEARGVLLVLHFLGGGALAHDGLG